MRNTLNQGQRKQLIEEYLRRSSVGEPSSQNALAEWAAQTFNFAQKPSQATISRLLKNRITISKSRTPDTAKRATVPRQPALEDALFSWVVAQKVRRGRVTSGTVRDFGRLLLKHVNERLPGNRNLEFRFSNGWMEKYKKRYGLKFWRANEDGEEEHNENVFDDGYPAFVRKLSTFKDDDIWTAAEFGVQYCMNSESSGHDESKLTILACCNKTGSERYPLTMIGKSSAKLSFDEATMKNIDFEYTSNINAWMTAKLFFSWLHAFDAHISRNRQRKVLLVLDSCSAHGNHETIPVLKNVEILFLPTSSIAKTLPMECGIVSTIKLRFKRQQLLSVLDRIDQGDNNPFYVNPLVAMRWLSQEWKLLSSMLVQSCWQQSLGNIGADKHQFLVESSREEAYEINELLNEVARVCGRVNIRSLLYSPDERDCIETVNLETLRDSVVDRLVTEKTEPQILSVSQVPALPPVDKQLKAFAIVRQVLDERGLIDNKLRTVVRDVQRAIRAEQAAKTGRATLFDYGGAQAVRQDVGARSLKQTRPAQSYHPSQEPENLQQSKQRQPSTHIQVPQQLHPPQRILPSRQSQTPQPSQISQQPQKPPQPPPFQQAEYSQQTQKIQGETTQSSTPSHGLATSGPWVTLSKTLSVKSSDATCRNGAKVSKHLMDGGSSQTNIPRTDENQLTDSPHVDVPIIAIVQDENVMKVEEPAVVTDQIAVTLPDREIRSGEQPPTGIASEVKEEASEAPSLANVERPVYHEHAIHKDPQVDESQMELSNSEFLPRENDKEGLDMTEAPS
eukprot:TRINITY_DN70794_c0_g1_i1.p1 TRINITY_DN70794_c0_g1~~TRINITY_DN70794_c0_g1_i1.p1  ORF type:complete len:790 (-),score=113.33 TRINITY_DN70794_c0_g1_i1:1724-4093(-)